MRTQQDSPGGVQSVKVCGASKGEVVGGLCGANQP